MANVAYNAESYESWRSNVESLNSEADTKMKAVSTLLEEVGNYLDGTLADEFLDVADKMLDAANTVLTCFNSLVSILDQVKNAFLEFLTGAGEKTKSSAEDIC